jgi:hypothetical protein
MIVPAVRARESRRRVPGDALGMSAASGLIGSVATLVHRPAGGRDAVRERCLHAATLPGIR